MNNNEIIENIKKAFFLIKPNSIKKDKKYILKNSKKPEIKKILTQNKIYL